MCKNKRLAALLLAGAMVLSATACGGSGQAPQEGGNSDTADAVVYRTLYASEVTTLNYLTTGLTNNWSIGANVVDNLVEYDRYGNLLPALAESWEHNDDMTEWTFHIRPGVKWVDKDGNEVADVTANDWVSTAHYVNDARNASDNQYMYSNGSVVVNANAYYDYTAYLLDCETYGFEEGDVNAVDDEGNPIEPVDPVDPDSIGVKAVDDSTLVFTLEQPCSFFLSALAYTAFMPVYGPFLEEQGSQFGLDNESLLYCGAYILSSYEPQQERVLTKNPTYWDAGNVYIDEIRQTYNAEAASIEVKMYLDGEIDNATVDTNLLDSMLADETTGSLIHGGRIDNSYSYFYSFNFDPQFDEIYEPENWRKAVNNLNFRKAVMASMDRVRAFMAHDPFAPERYINNTITPADFVLGDGVDYTQFEPLKPYTDGDSFDADAAVAYRDKAREELEAEGVTFPIKVLMSYNPTSSGMDDECQLVEQQIENVLGTDFIDIIIEAGPETSFLTAVRRSGKYAFMSTNWGADYADPQTWTEPFGLDNSYGFWDKSEDPETKALFAQWYELVYGTKAAVEKGLKEEGGEEIRGAAEIYENDTDRYNAFAKAEALLIENAIVVPYSISQGSTYSISNLNPLEGEYSPFGVSQYRYKYQKLYDTSMSMEEFEEAYEKWEEERSSSAAD